MWAITIRITGENYLVSDMCETAVMGGREVQILGMITNRSKEINNISYIGVKVINLLSFRLKLINTDGSPIEMTVGETYFVLNFKHKNASFSTVGEPFQTDGGK